MTYDTKDDIGFQICKPAFGNLFSVNRKYIKLIKYTRNVIFL